jgi:hypothetical protein
VIQVSADSAAFTGTAGGADPAPQAIQITNAGPGTLDSLIVSQEVPTGQTNVWLWWRISVRSAPATLTIEPRIRSLTPGTYRGSLFVQSPHATNGPIEIALTLTVSPADSPAIAFSAFDHQFNAVKGGAEAAPATVQVTNAGKGSLTGLGTAIRHLVGEPTEWLTATLNQTTAPATLTVTARMGSLAPGLYHALVEVTSPVASNSPQLYAVVFDVSQTTAGIGVSPTSVEFSAVQGGSDPIGRNILILNVGPGSLTGLTQEIVYAAGQPTGWLSARLRGTSAPVYTDIAARLGALPPGRYTANVLIRSPDAPNSPLALPVTFAVESNTPSIVLNPSVPRNYTLSPTENTKSEDIAVTNGGGGTLSGLATSITYDRGAGWLQARFAATTAPATLSLTVSRGSLAAGIYQALVSISAPGASTKDLLVQLTVQAAAPPSISVSVTTRAFSATANGANPPAQQAGIGNSGAGTLSGLTVTANPPVSWLAVNLSSTTAPATATFQVTTGTLAAGTYSTTVNVSSAVASNSPQSVTVTFTVAPQPTRPTTLRIINDLPADVVGPNDWSRMNTVIRFRVGPTQTSVINLTGGAVELLYPVDYTSDEANILAIAPGHEPTFDVSSLTGEYWIYVQTGWWEYTDGLYEKHMTRVVGCDGVSTVYKWTTIRVYAPFGDPEVIRLSDFLPIGNYYLSPFCP